MDFLIFADILEMSLTAVITTLVTSVVGGVGYWLIWGRTLVSREEVSKMIETESEYSQDKRIIFERLDGVHKITQEFSSQVKELVNVMHDLKVEFAKFSVIIKYINRHYDDEEKDGG